LKGTQN